MTTVGTASDVSCQRPGITYRRYDEDFAVVNWTHTVRLQFTPPDRLMSLHHDADEAGVW